MADSFLTAVDESLAARTGMRRHARPDRRPAPASTPVGPEADTADDEHAPHEQRDQILLVAFLCVQFLWGALLFIPGAQAIRPITRALPYVASVGLLVFFFPRRVKGHRPHGATWIVAVLVLLVMNLLHPSSQLTSGVAQCVFQVMITAPLFWSHKVIRSPRQLERLLVLVFVLNLLSAGLGVLQVYLPDRFMPPQFNSLGIQLNSMYVDSLTYEGRDGRMIVRPPGLTDQPGGAAVAGGLTALLGLGLLMRRQSAAMRLFLLSAISVGLAAVYLTQVRVVLLMVVGTAAVMTAVAIRQRRTGAAVWIGGSGAALVVVAFLWASSVGGQSVDERFLSIRDQGALATYQENRGGFLSLTLGEMLDEYPLGAGAGRWGMMNTYFADTDSYSSAPIHAEIQLTGWLLDGGIPMWLLYGGALLSSVLATLKLTAARDDVLSTNVMLVVALQVFIIGSAMAGPVFNTQLGILFWTAAAGLHGAATGLFNGAASPDRSHAEFL